MKAKKAVLLISVLSFATALIYNEINLYFLRSEGIPLRNGQTIITHDDDSYLDPAENYLQSSTFRENFPGSGSYYLRPPGYSIFYLVFRVIGNKTSALVWLKLFQILFFAASIYCLYWISFVYSKDHYVSSLICVIYGCTPLGSGFLYYTLTEGITPALMIFYAYFLFKARLALNPFSKRLDYILACLIFSILFITRPVLGIAVLAVPAYLIFDNRHKITLTRILLQLILYGMIALTPMVIWQVRNYIIAGHYVGLHPVYDPENNFVFRPAHKAVWELEKCWGSGGKDFHESIMPAWMAALQGDTSEKWIDTMIANVPEYTVAYFGRNKLQASFRAYRNTMVYQKKFKDNKLPMPKEIPKTEQKVISDFNSMTKEFKISFPLQNYIISPLITLKRMIFHSNLSFYMFQKTFRGNLLMEIIRWLFLIIHASAYILFGGSLLIKKISVEDMFFVLIPLIYIFYLAYFQRGVEERYTLPILPFVITGSMFVVRRCVKSIFC